MYTLNIIPPVRYNNCDFFFFQEAEEEVEEDSGVVEGEGEGSEVVGDSGGGNPLTIYQT